MKRFFPLLALALLCSIHFCKAQIGVSVLKVKDFYALGKEAFLKFHFQVSQGNYVTVGGGINYYVDSYDEEVGLVPVLVGYRYTLDQSGNGLYLEPNAGYAFGETTITAYDKNGQPIPDPNNPGQWANEKVAGPMAGLEVGYLFDPAGWVQFSVGLRYEHGFGNAGTNLLSLNITHAFNFGRRRFEY